MSTMQEPLGVKYTNVDPSWRKRPAHLGTSMAHRTAKRLKHSLTESSSGRTHDKDARQGLAGAQASIPSNSISKEKAERWFDHTNEHPRDVSFVDSDPPYYMRDQMPDYNSACATRSENPTRNVSRIGPTAPTRSLLAQMNADNNDGDDYRSVIDDLTIQNKKLKKKLKKYEVLHCSHLQEEKLFEVRIHGLTANRKHELEETLRSFASSIDEDLPHRPLPTDAHAPVPSTTAPLQHKPSSSTTSASKPALDSAYASMSGQTAGASQSHPAEQNVQEKGVQGNRQSVSSYLHDIPEALAPRSSVAMSDRSKSKSIVRKLEQLFTGKAAASRQHGQSLQQQEVSQSAALANGQRSGQEGTREAHILSADAELQVDPVEEIKTRASNEGSNAQNFQASRGNSPRSPEQRPTRPLDLDPHRAQNPADNMDYIRHLSLTSGTNDPVDGPANKDGWVYLNLLTGMAQLHTLNVTPEFIRKAISDFSSKLEISPDRTGVRWLGGSTGTRVSSDGDESEDQIYGKPSGSSNGVSSRDEALDRPFIREHAAGELCTASEVGAKRRPINLNGTKDEAGDIQYKPLFFHTAASDDDEFDVESGGTDTSDFPDFTAATGINSGATTYNHRVTRLRGPRKKDGPMIFYNRAKFCTDLSGDLEGARRKQCNYYLFTHQPVGASRIELYENGGSKMKDHNVCFNEETVSEDIDKLDTYTPLNLDDLRSVVSDFAATRSSRSDPMDMEASGLGGIQPEDNFVVRVQVQHGNGRGAHRNSPSKSWGLVQSVAHHNLGSSLDGFAKTAETARGHTREHSFQGKVISSVRTDMAPSALPPPSYVCLPFSSSGSEGDESEAAGEAETSSPSQVDRAGVQHSPMGRRGALMAMRGQPSRYSCPTTPYAESDDGSDDSSIDLLAHARGLDPETIAAREREFESNTRDLAEVPAGSSAATNGGGSGRASPRHANGEGSDINSMSVDGDGSI